MPEGPLVLTSPPARTGTRRKARPVPVWDRFVRVFHWSLVGLIAVAAATGFLGDATWVDVHVWGGTAALALVAARVIWGLTGTTHARFSDFVAGPRAILAHIRALAAGRAGRHFGHNPLGGLMILALLAMIVALTATGVVVLGGVLKSGPVAFATSFATGWDVRGIHKILAIGLLAMIGLHVAGAVFESLRTRENLVRAMVHGRKESRPGDAPPPHKVPRPVLAGVLMVVLLTAGAGTVFALAQRPGLGVPHAKLDPVYAKECGDCHVAYHPSLAPAATWSGVMADLSHHFGDNAELDAATASHIRDYLLANSAEHYDTLPANRLRRTDPAHPLRITATPFWRRMHRRIPDSTFAAKQVVARSNCSACHHDVASGLFHPSAIEIPEDAEP